VFALVDFNRPAAAAGRVREPCMSASAPHSPCINVCNISPSGWCRGCYRTLEEIGGWLHLDAAGQWSVLRACDARRLAQAQPATRPKAPEPSPIRHEVRTDE
jgi:uncharacterized protein